jgi:hypothetical protein
MAKRGRIATPVEMLKPHQTIEVDHQFMFRIGHIQRVMVFDMVEGTEKTGYVIHNYGSVVQAFFEEYTLVDLVDESTLTHVPFD